MRRLRFRPLVYMALLLSLLAPLMTTLSAHALSGSDFSAGRIIDDTIFYNSTLLGGPDNIQSFLNSKVPACDTNGLQQSTHYNSAQNRYYTRAEYGSLNGNPAPYVCLRDYSQDTPAKAAENGLCAAYNGGRKTAAQIIFDVAQACGVSPGALVVLLQKEQSLVTDDWPWADQYKSGTGYGCPDTAACDSQYYGFFNQVYSAARQFRNYKLKPTSFNYRAGRSAYVAFNPNSSCGPANDGQHEIYIENSATAALYNYTPYRPNQAALTNLYGSGDNCSAYGNRNFWRLFNEWFGSTATSARVILTRYDVSTDSSGGSARIGLSLNQKPSASVTIPVHLSDTSAAGFVSASQIVITPDTWNRPDLNQVVLFGKSNGTNGSQYYQLVTDNPGTTDAQFRTLTGEFVEDATLTNFDGTSLVVSRLYSVSTGYHAYTANLSEKNTLVSKGYTDEGTAFYYCKSGESTVDRLLLQNGKPFLVPEGTSEAATAQSSGYQLDVPLFTVSQGATVPVYRLFNTTSKDHFYTINLAERDNVIKNYGYTLEGVAFNTCTQNKQPVYRMYKSSNNDHFFTTAPSERDSAGSDGYQFEGVGFYIDNTQTTTPLSVFRLLNNKGQHFYTTAPSERDAAIGAGYKLEGVGFALDQTTPNVNVYRLINLNTGAHFYTISSSEKTAATNAGFNYEGVGFVVNP